MESVTNVLVVSPSWALPWCDALRRAHPGERVEVLDADSEQLRRELPRVARALRERQGQQRIYFLGAAFDRGFDPDDREAVTAALGSGALALAALLRGLHEAGSHTFVLQLLTVGAHAATPLEVPHPCAAAVYGLLRVYVKEFRGARVYCEDRALDELRSLDANVWARECASREVEKGLEEVAIRGGVPLRRALERLQLDETASPPLRTEGVYLVLGGAGGIGLELSKWLARNFRAKVAWIGRSGLDAEKQRHIRDVEELGGRVLYRAADASDEAALRACIAGVERELGPVEGAFHSALALDDKPIVQLDDACMRKVLAPKTLGSLSLWRALRHRPLAFLTFFSSSQALAANPGQANYAAGSAFQDAFAGWLAQRGTCPVRTINWGYWGSVGAVASPKYRARFAALGVHSIEPEQGMEAMKRILSNPVTQVLAFNGSEEMFRERGLLEDSECRVFSARAPSTISVLDAAFPRFEFRRRENRELEAHVCDLVLMGLQGLGVLTPAGRALRPDSSGASLGVLPKYAALWREFLRMLRGAGYVEAKGDGLHAARNVPLLDRAELARRGEQLSRSVPEFAAVLQLAERCAIDLPRVLTGSKPATEVIFPRSSVELVEGIYKDNAVSDYFNALVVEATLRRLQQQLAGSRAQHATTDTSRFRILEVGAGTGGTSRPLLDALAPFGHALEYVYTDVSRAFLIHGKKQYGHHPFVRFERCDVAETLAGQGFAPGSFDVVVATNVLHATPRIRDTLRNLKAALRGGGWLVINEATALRGFSTLIFGLLDGWWAFEDGDQRIAGSPLLSVELWDRALRSEGFRSVRALGEASDERPLEQHVIVAESDGVVRLRESPPAARTPAVSAALGEEHESSVPEQLAIAEQGGAVERAIASVAAVVGRVLEMPGQSIDPDERFSELGVDSVLAVEIASQLSEESGVELRSTELFNYGSVRDLATHLAGRAAMGQERGGQLSRVLEDADAQQETPEQTGALLPLILTTVANVLELEVQDVGADEVFANLGVDSVLAVEIAARLSEALGWEVRTVDLFSHGSARELELALGAQRSSLARLTPAAVPASASPRASTSAPPALVTSDFPDIEIDEEPTVAPRAAAASSPASPREGAPARASEKVAAPVSATGELQGSSESLPGIAIVGMSGRFPGAASVEEFWKLLRDGKNAVREAPERWDLEAFYGADPPSPPPGFKTRAGFLDDVLRFDALFFGITPKEAELMDPQQRLVLEEGFRALEDAGYSRALLKRTKCGAYIGAGNVDYLVVLRQLGIVDDPSLLTGNVSSILAARLAYALDLTGPAIAVDTACSSSLVAIHLACEALRGGSVDMAIAGGVAVLNTPGFSLLAQRAGMLAPDGICKTFDNRANGMVPGEGVGMLVLKRLDDALRDRDHIHGVIVASGVNQDGRTNGITAPSAVSQAALETEVYRAHAIDPEGIDFVECHGTGTKLGDPIEVQALTDAFREFTERRAFCALGSVKTNIGHTLSAAGVAGVMKVLLSLRHQQLPASLHFEEPNEHIDFAASPFFVQRSLSSWPRREDRPRRSAVSSFGFSGTNAHLVIEEPPAPPLAGASEGPFLFALSARTRAALSARARDLAAWIDAAGAGVPAAHVAYTLLCRRTHHPVRWATVARDLGELRSQLQTWAEPGGPRSGALAEGSDPSGSSSALETELGRYLIREIEQAGPGQRSQKLEACGVLFVKGAELDWRALFPERATVSLPTYPFEGERHLPAPRGRLSSGDGAARERPRPETELLLQKTWIPSAPETPGERAVESIAGRWLVLVDEGSSEIGARLRERSRLSAQRAGTRADFSRVEFDVVELAKIEAASAAGAVELASAAHRSGPIRGVIDLADVWPAERDVAERRAERLAFVQGLVAGWLDRNDGSSYGYFHFAQGASDGSGSTVCLRGAFFAGLPAVLASEHRGIRARSVSVDVEPGQLEPLFEVIAHELASGEASVESSWRRGVRHLPALAELRAGGAAPTLSGAGYWVITGATGGIGAVLAKEWVARGVRRLALLVHRPLPPRNQWQALLAGEAAGGVDADTLARIRAIHEIESSGASVRLYQGSLCDAAQLSSFFTACRQQWGAMKGVLHCAGAFVAGQNAFVRRDLIEATRVLEPKVEGLQALYGALLPFAPEHFVLFSSIASLCPSLSSGIGEYALANGFMNRFAELTRRTGSPVRVQAIAWSNWEGIGFGNVDSPRFHALGLERHSSEQGIALLDQALRSGAPVLLAGKCDRVRWDSDRALRAHPAPPSGPRSSSRSDESRVRPAPGAAEVGSLRERGVVRLRELLARELHIPEASLHENTPFQDFGVDSILMVELLKRMESELRGQLDPSMFLEHPTLARLSEHLLATNTAFAELMSASAAPALPPEALPSAAPSSPAVEPGRPGEQTSRTGERSRAIAIVGVGCNLPGARGKEAFWAALRTGYSGIREVPPSRWNAADLYRERYAAGRSISKWGGFIDHIESFDADYFGLPEAMAPQVDPLIRQLLEVSVECLADAGYRSEELAGKSAGIFIGARAGNYGRRIAAPTRDTAVALGQNFIAAHVAHFLDLRGPALVVDTACSSSLVSLHLACQSLRSHECDLALAGGVDLLLDESPYLTLSEAKALSPSGRCFTFDVRANGFVPGEGAAVVLLKRLDAALADGDQIYAIIEGSAVNNDGRTMGVTTPNPEAQASVVRAALADAGVEAASLSYLEAHGTGTMIGDPIELKALTKVFRETTSEVQFCAIGSVKSNIGHLMSAAGIASVIKTVLCLKHGELVPTINCETPNPRFAFADSPFYVGTQSEAWQLHHGTRRAGVSSFGFGGTNAHVILAQPPPDEAPDPAVKRQPLGPVHFDRKRYWLDPPGSAPAARPRPALLELTRRKPSTSIHTSAPNGEEPTFELMAGES